MRFPFVTFESFRYNPCLLGKEMPKREGAESTYKGLKWRTVTIIAEGVAQIGFVIVMIVLTALALGLWLDSRFGTRPWLTLGLVLVSIPVSLLVLVRVAMSVAMRAANSERLKRDNSEEKGGGEGDG